jgi:hypothetical protein
VGSIWNNVPVFLFLLRFSLQEERDNGEQALSGISKTHEKMKNEQRGIGSRKCKA